MLNGPTQGTVTNGGIGQSGIPSPPSIYCTCLPSGIMYLLLLIDHCYYYIHYVSIQLLLY